MRVGNAVNYGGLGRLEEQRDALNKHLASDPSQQVSGSGRPKDGAVIPGPSRPAVAGGATGRSPPADMMGRWQVAKNNWAAKEESVNLGTLFLSAFALQTRQSSVEVSEDFRQDCVKCTTAGSVFL